MPNMDLTDSEVNLVLRSRRSPEQRREDTAAQRAAQEATMLARMTLAERAKWEERKRKTPNERLAAQIVDILDRNKAVADLVDNRPHTPGPVALPPKQPAAPEKKKQEGKYVR